MQQDPITQKLTLEADIRLLERKKDTLLLDIDRIQVSRANGFKKDREQVDLLSKQHDALVKEIQIHQTTLEKLQLEEKKTRESIKLYTESEIAKINEELDAKRAAIEARIKLADEKELGNIDERQKLDHFRRDLDQKALILDQKEKDNTENEQKLQILGTEIREQVSASEVILAKNKEEIEVLDARIGEKTGEITQLDAEIKTKTNQNKWLADNANKRISEAVIKELAVVGREEVVAKRETAASIKERQLNDRTETMKRAMNEIAQKGGRI